MKKQFFLSIVALTSFAPTLVHAHPLYKAAQQGDREKVCALIQSGANVHARPASNPNEQPIHAAVNFGHIAIARELLRAGANPEARGCTGQTALHYAASNGSRVLIQLLLRHRANVQTEDDHRSTPLHVAAGSGNMVGTQELLRANADIEAKSIWGSTPLHCALNSLCIESKGPVIEALLSIGASLPHKDTLSPQQELALEQHIHIAQRWAWEAQQALLAYKKDIPAKPSQDLVQLICQFATNATPKGPEGLFGWFKYYIGF